MSHFDPSRRILTIAAIVLLAPVLAACGNDDESGGGGSDARSLNVSSSEDACELSATEAPEAR